MSLYRHLRASHRLSLRFSSSAPSTPPQPPPLPSPDPNNPKPNPTISLSKTINSLFKERDLDCLISLFKHSSASSNFRRRHLIYENAVRRLAHHSRFDGVAEILEAQKQYQSDITREGFAVRLISLYGKAGMADHASNTFLELPSLSCPRTVMSFNALLSAFVDAGDSDRAVESFRSVPVEIPDIVPDLFSYNILIHALCEKGDVDAGMGVLESMEEKGMEPNSITFNVLLRGLYSNRRFEEAEELWSRMREKNCEWDLRSFNEKLMGLVIQGRVAEALMIFKEMESKGLKPNTYTFNALIMGHCKDGNLDGAKRVFAELKKKECIPNAKTFEAILPSLCKGKELDLAFRLGKKSVVHLVAVDVLQGVVDELAKASKLEDAKKLVELGLSRDCYRESLRMPSPCLAL